jgi:hypothetical protein
MKSLLPIWREWRLFLLKWALREIDPMHPDVPNIVREIAHWEACRV